MTRQELLTLAIGRARANGFEFRRWYTTRLGLPWISSEAAITLLDSQRRYYALIFSHEFAQSFWKPGSEITFDVPARTFERTMPDGSVRTVKRKAFIRRSARPNAWRYHLRQMALSEEPLRHLRKYLRIDDDLQDEAMDANSAITSAPTKKAAKAQPAPRPLPADLPSFLQRPYRGSAR